MAELNRVWASGIDGAGLVIGGLGAALLCCAFLVIAVAAVVQLSTRAAAAADATPSGSAAIARPLAMELPAQAGSRPRAT